MKFNLVLFYSEGPPFDNGIDLSKNYEIVMNAAKIHFDNIEVYTPTKLIHLGYGEYVKRYDTGTLQIDRNKRKLRNPGMNSVGFEAWKPLIIHLELNKMNDDDILIYRDFNAMKYERLACYNNIRNLSLRCLDLCGFDFFISKEDNNYQIKNLVKTNIIRELGEDHPFTYNFPMFIANFIVVRKSNVSRKLIQEWMLCSVNEEWRNGEQYGPLHTDFIWTTNTQAILCVILSNWIRKRVCNIPLDYPRVSFRGSHIICNEKSNLICNLNHDHLKYL